MCFSLRESTPPYTQCVYLEITAILTPLSRVSSLDNRRYSLWKRTILVARDLLEEFRLDAIIVSRYGDPWRETIRLFPPVPNLTEVQHCTRRHIFDILLVTRYQKLYRTMFLVLSLRIMLWELPGDEWQDVGRLPNLNNSYHTLWSLKVGLVFLPFTRVHQPEIWTRNWACGAMLTFLALRHNTPITLMLSPQRHKSSIFFCQFIHRWGNSHPHGMRNSNMLKI